MTPATIVTTTITDNDTATWSLTGTSSLAEGTTASYTLALAGTLQAGETAKVDLTLSFPVGGPSTDPAEAADFVEAFLDDVDTAITAYNTAGNAGTFARSGNTLTYTQGGSDGGVDDLGIDLATDNDTLVEGPEDYRLTISAATSTTARRWSWIR